MESATTSTASRYRLRGQIDGKLSILALPLGPQRVGSSPESDVFLPVSGVSREHALVLVTPEGLSVEDRGSKNGTRVDGQLVERHALYPGARVAFGPVAFEVEEVEVADLVLAICVHPSPDPRSDIPIAFPPAETTSLPEVFPGSGPAGPQAEPGSRSADPELVFPEGYVAGISSAMRVLHRQLRVAAAGDMPVLLVGETGVGKEMLVATLHRSSERRDRPLVAINCAAIPADLLEAELFGIDKGVATGVRARPGKFRQAEGGTLFLDEIAELMPALQAKLLRALQEKEIQPVGGPSRTVDVRLVAATNADLEERLEKGSFRRDLYYRLAGDVLRVPPLRERPEDLPILVEHFLRTFADEAGIRLRGMTVNALQLFAGYAWPGNVRELQHESRRLVHECQDGGVVEAAMLAKRFRQRAASNAGEERLEHAESLLLSPRLRDLETRLIREALRRTKGLQNKAAVLLGISRNGLADKIKRLGITAEDYRVD